MFLVESDTDTIYKTMYDKNFDISIL